jgi:hypothetical protein
MFRDVAIMNIYGVSMTWVGNLLCRMNAGRNGGCGRQLNHQDAWMERERGHGRFLQSQFAAPGAAFISVPGGHVWVSVEEGEQKRDEGDADCHLSRRLRTSASSLVSFSTASAFSDF